MASEKIQALVRAMGALSEEELYSLEKSLCERLGMEIRPSGENGLKIFFEIQCEVPYLYYDGGPVHSIWIDGAGSDCIAFAKLINEYTELGPFEARHRYLDIERSGEVVKFDVARDKADEFIEALKGIQASFEYSIDDIADYKTIQVHSMPAGCEERLYHVLMEEIRNGTVSQDMCGYKIYEYTIEPEEDILSVDDLKELFELFDPIQTRDGSLLWHMYSVLGEAEIRKIRKNNQNGFHFRENRRYYVRLPEKS